MRRLFLAAALVLLFAAPTRADEPVQVAGLYSDMYFNRARGSLLGVEVFVVPAHAGYYVMFQGAGGAPDVPVVVPATVDDNRIAFTLPEGTGYSGTFTGIVTGDTLVGSFAPAQLNRVTDTWEFRLRRKPSYWQ